MNLAVLKEALQNRPKYEELDSVGGMESYAVQAWGSRVDVWFEDFEAKFSQLEQEPQENAKTSKEVIDSYVGTNNWKLDFKITKKHKLLSKEKWVSLNKVLGVSEKET